MKKLILTIIFFLLIPQMAWGAIAHDTSTFDNNTDTSAASHTTAFTVTGSDTLLVVGIRAHQGDRVTGVTYNGDDLTQITKHDAWAGYAYLYYMVAPDTGSSYNVVVSMSPADYCYVTVMSYTGVLQDVYNASASDKASVSNTVATVNNAVDDSWMVVFGYNAAGVYSSVTNGAFRSKDATYGATAGSDSDGTVASGNNTITMVQHPSSGGSVWVAATFSPAGGAPPASAAPPPNDGLILFGF